MEKGKKFGVMCMAWLVVRGAKVSNQANMDSNGKDGGERRKEEEHKQGKQKEG